jgi:2-polyprenyl-3-methyl-5-hydroxy-6-metoxy-1,4-benzoquinol methylase
MKNPEKFWNFLAKNFDKTENKFESIHNKTLDITKKYLHPSDTVLDYGCATGKKTIFLADKVKQIYGIDFSAKMIELAQKHAIDKGIKNIYFSHTVIFNDELKCGSFDVILVFNVLHLVENLHDVMQRISYLLKPGGILITSTPCINEQMDKENNFKFSIFQLLQKTRLLPKYIAKFTFCELEDLILGKGFQILETQKLYDGISGYFIAAKKTEVAL